MRLGYAEIEKSIGWLIAAGYLVECDGGGAHAPTSTGMIVAPNGMGQLLWHGYLATCFGIGAELVGTGLAPYNLVQE